jgi:hypothetical protein
MVCIAASVRQRQAIAGPAYYATACGETLPSRVLAFAIVVAPVLRANGMSSCTFCSQPERFWRLECQPGEEAQVDFGLGAPIEDG